MPQCDAGPAMALVGSTDRSLAAVCPAGGPVRRMPDVRPSGADPLVPFGVAP
jgi:hypothetical protein